MINIEKKLNCCGCTACVQKCPKQCIQLKMDNEGFSYPIVNVINCVDCHICEKVCPILLNAPKRIPIKVYAAINENERIIKESSSGGIFTYVAEQIIKNGGVVFGARFDEKWKVKLDYTESKEGLAAFRGSKYVQASVGDTYKQAESFLKEGRIVLFTGTPCQIAGLKGFLRKEYANLVTLDFLCHGVPSPKVWSKYLNELFTSLGKKKKLYTSNSDENDLIAGIKFRDKSLGWRKFSFVLHVKSNKNTKENSVSFSQYHRKNTYMKGFLEDLYLRPSCYSCRFKRFQSGSDITVADYWGISRVNPNFEDKNGVSIVFINSANIINNIDFSKLKTIVTTFEATLSNKGLNENVVMHRKRDYFFKKLDDTNSLISLIEKCVEPSILEKITNKIKMFFK